MAIGIAILALTRRSGEDIVIIDTETGEEIVVTVFESRAQQTRIGIEASKRFKILRREVLEHEEASDVN